MPFAAGDLPDEPARTTPGTRGANASFGTFRPVAGKNFPDFTSFTYWQGSNTTDDFNAGTHEVAGTGWSIEGMTKGMIWGYRTLRSDYEEHKTLLRDLESQHTAHAAATLDSFTQVRGILDHLRADGLALRAELQDVHAKILGDSATILLLSRENDELKAEQQRLQRLIWDQAQQTGRVEESLRHYQLGYSGRLDEMATSHLHLETAFRGERVRLDASTARVAGLLDRVAGLMDAMNAVRADVTRTWTRVQHESTRGDNMHNRLEELEVGARSWRPRERGADTSE
jgi:chromosome segregation ATPase